MNAFYEHHKDNIRFSYRCFDRLLLNGLIQPFQQPERVVGFFNTYRQLYPVSRDVLRDIATQYHNWAKNRSQKWGVPIQEDPPGRRDDFVERYFRRAQSDQVVAIIKAREPATIMTAIGKDDRWHLEMKRRWVEQYNFYVQESRWGQMFVRVCPYFPFSARVCLNQHYWLALRLRERDIHFQQCANAFVQCSDPETLQKLADSLTAKDLITCTDKWLARFTPFFTPEERKQASVQHRLFFAQVEFCDNLIFRRRAAVDALTVPLPRFVTQTLAPSNATPLTGELPTGNVSRRGPVPRRLTRIRVTELLAEFATQMFAPSNPMPLGKVPTVNFPRVKPSLARNCETVPSLLLLTQMLRTATRRRHALRVRTTYAALIQF